MTADQLESVFRDRGEVRGGILLLAAKDARALIDSARQHNVRVLGVDGFTLTQRTTEPMMEHSLDLTASGAPEVRDPWTTASEFLRGFEDTSLRFEVVLE